MTASEELSSRAGGRPAPFTQDQVDALVRGALPEEEIAAVLEAFPAERSDTRRTRSSKRAPIELEAKDLRGLAEGTTPPELEKRFDSAAKADRRKLRGTKEAKRPRNRPPKN